MIRTPLSVGSTPVAATPIQGAIKFALISVVWSMLLAGPAEAIAQGSLERHYPLLNQAAEQQARRRVYTPTRRVFLTRDGSGYMSFPNYDIRLFPGAFGGFSEEITGLPQTYPSVIYKSRGYYWDGDEFFLSPNYPYDELTRFRYGREIVGAPPGTVWPPGPEPRYQDITRPTPARVQPGGEPPPLSPLDVTRIPKAPEDHVQRFLGIPLPPPPPPATEEAPDIPEDYPSWQKAASEDDASANKKQAEPPSGSRRLRKAPPPRLQPLREIGPQPPKD